MSDEISEARWALLSELTKEEEEKILKQLEYSVEDNKKNFRHQYLGEPFEKGDDYEKRLNSGNFDSDLIEDHEEFLEEMARKERLEQGPLMDSGYVIPNFYRKYR